MSIMNPRAVRLIRLSPHEQRLIEAMREDPRHYIDALKHLSRLDLDVTGEITTEPSFAADLIREHLEGIDAEMNVERLAAAS